MRFGIFDHLERRSDVDLAQQYEERLQLVEQADAAGFYAYHVAEHHHSPLCLAPNQSVYLAAVAQRTKRLRFGPLVYVLPLHHPVRLVEEIGMVDQLSGGRYQVGVGPGTGGGTEFGMWGGNPHENYERFEETLEILRKGLQCDFLTHRGRYFQFEDLWMEVRPVQRPHPPFWWAGSPESAARRGAHYIGTGSMRGMAQSMARYLEVREEVAAATRDPLFHPPEPPLYGGMKHVFVGDDDAVARERAAAAYEVYRTHYAKPRPEGSLPAAPDDGAAARGPSGFDAQTALERGILIAGSPATLRRFAERYASEVQANYFVGAFQWGDLTHEEASRSLDLFAREVMPAFGPSH